jgi:hypothetical protein
MAKTQTQQEKQSGKVNDLPEDIAQVTPKAGPVDLTKKVKVTTTDTAPYHKASVEIEVSPALAEKMKKNGWAK